MRRSVQMTDELHSIARLSSCIFFFSPPNNLKSFGKLKKLLDGFVRESSMPAVFSRKDPNLRLLASFEARFERFEYCFRQLRSKSCFKMSSWSSF